jgi:hypothetical protein
LKLSQSLSIAGLQGAALRSDVPDFFQIRPGKVQPEFKKAADECKTHLGEELFSHQAILKDIYMDSHETQLSRAKDGPLNKVCSYLSSAVFRMHQPPKDNPPNVWLWPHVCIANNLSCPFCYKQVIFRGMIDLAHALNQV